MAFAPSFCGVILAAGDAPGGRDPALTPYGGRTLLSAHIAMLQPHSELVIVVAGKNAPVLAPVVYANAAYLTVNPDPACGQFSSLRLGLREVLNHGRDAAIVSLLDRPPVGAGTLDALCNAFVSASAGGKWAVVPQYQEHHGHPLLVRREMIEAFLRAAATSNAKEIEQAHLDRIEYIPVDDPLVVAPAVRPAENAKQPSS